MSAVYRDNATPASGISEKCNIKPVAFLGTEREEGDID
jgi:hypothetical protein